MYVACRVRVFCVQLCIVYTGPVRLQLYSCTVYEDPTRRTLQW